MEKIEPDIGILLGSQSDDIFNEMLDIYPNARKLYDVVIQAKCSCGDPSCPRKCFQYVLEVASEGDLKRAADFIEEASKECSCPAEVRELMVRYYEKNQGYQNKESGLPSGLFYFNSLQEAEDFLNSVGSGPGQD